MIYFFSLVLLFLFFVILFLIYKIYKIKKIHSQKMEQLHFLIFSQNQKQKALNKTVLISEQFDSSYNSEIKILGYEVLALQKIFIDIINKKNNKF